ncbi:MAG: aspartate ammonia-lyase [Oligoflexia bacterium]|nr:aspartate ammonia-lyase [Oligoflexia bacterium]
MNTETRKERDELGEMDIEGDALYGIHSLRAKSNFPVSDICPFHIEWYQNIGLVKKACYLTYVKYKHELTKKYDLKRITIPLIYDHVLKCLMESSQEIINGDHFQHFIVPGISGGAGTSINLNVNEIICNLTKIKLSESVGLSDAIGLINSIDPIETANVFQSTNDVIPSALKITLIFLLKKLEDEISCLRKEIEKKENIYRDVLRIGYTQLQEAVPTSFGKLFSSQQRALSRDWWRVSKCFERLKTINIGGGAIGTGLAIPQFFIFEVINQLREISNLPLTRGEDLTDTTSNLDVLVEVHAILKAHAVNLEKISSDLRLLASDFHGQFQLCLPKKQVGSSIMPAKINPVIAEFVISSSHKIYVNDQLVSSLCGQGHLELNAYLPIIGHTMIESIKLLIAANKTLNQNMIQDLNINLNIRSEESKKKPSISTALIPYIGHKQAAKVASLMREKSLDIESACQELNILSGVLDRETLNRILSPGELLKLGFTYKEILERLEF